MMRSTVNSRGVAALALDRWSGGGLLAACNSPDRSFVQDMLYTAVKRLGTIDYVLGFLVQKRPKPMARSLLRIGTAQILYMSDVAVFAAVNETVEAAKQLCAGREAPFVNGVLRELARNLDVFKKKVSDAPLYVRESYPLELVDRWTARFGSQVAETIAKSGNLPGATFLAKPDGTYSFLERGRRVEDVPGYAEGKFIVQDPATAAAIDLLAPQSCERILDACAAPGGKTIQCAWRGAEVVACEPNAARRGRLAANIERTRLTDKVRICDTPPDSVYFDKALVDAPCSNTGVLRRRPDARWNWSLDKMSRLCDLQAEILDDTAHRVRPGGMLVYSTCSMEPDENAFQVASFLERNPQWAFVRSREMMPHLDGCDGAYAALLRHKEIVQ